MAADLSKKSEQSHLVCFSSLTMTCWQVLLWYCVPMGFADGVVGSLYKMESTNTCRQASFWQHSLGPVAGCKDHFPRSVWYSGLSYTSACGTAGVSGKDFVRQ